MRFKKLYFGAIWRELKTGSKYSGRYRLCSRTRPAYNLDFHVAPVDSMPMQCIICCNIIQLAEIIVDRNGTKINNYAHTFFSGNITLSEKK